MYQNDLYQVHAVSPAGISLAELLEYYRVLSIQ